MKTLSLMYIKTEEKNNYSTSRRQEKVSWDLFDFWFKQVAAISIITSGWLVNLVRVN